MWQGDVLTATNIDVQLLNGKYSFPDDNFMLWRKKKKTNFTVSSRKEIIREMKVCVTRVAPA